MTLICQKKRDIAPNYRTFAEVKRDFPEPIYDNPCHIIDDESDVNVRTYAVVENNRWIKVMVYSVRTATLVDKFHKTIRLER